MTDSSSSMQRPEGALIQAAMLRKGVKAPWVAERTELSANWIRHVINGYEPQGQGRRNPIIGPADTIARIARVLDITPAQLTEVGREDAADALQAILAVTPALAGGIDREALVAIAENRNRPDHMRREARAYLAAIDAAQALLHAEQELREAERRAC